VKGEDESATKAAGQFKVSVIKDADPLYPDRVFTAICHHWMHGAPEERAQKATWYIAELLSGSFTIMFPCSGPIEASDFMADPQKIVDRIASDLRKWRCERYRDSVARSNSTAPVGVPKAKRRTQVMDDLAEDRDVEMSSASRFNASEVNRHKKNTAKDEAYDHGREIAKAVDGEMKKGGA